jgi:hypothetical protein
MERTYVDIVKGQLLLICQIEAQVANNLENLSVLNCDTSPDPACESMHQLAMMDGNELRSSLQNRRRALYRAADSLSVFFAAHAALGDLLASRKTDAAVLEQMKSAGGKAKTSVEAELAAAEAERNCPYKAPPPETEQP